MPAKLILKDTFKCYTLDQDKTLAPEETVARLQAKLQKLDMRILDHVDRIDNGRLNIPVYMSFYGADGQRFTGNRKQMGKGASPAQAKASAMMELAERFSFFSFAKTDSHFTCATPASADAEAMSMDRMIQAAGGHGAAAATVERLLTDLRFKWCHGYNLTQNQPCQIAFDWFYNLNQFNGACAGNCNEEAILQGLCEVVERHACAIVSRQRQPVPRIDPDSVTDPAACELIAKYQRAGIDLYISDFSLQIGMPVVGVLAHDPKTFPETSELVWTAGCASDPQKALSRALTETAQLGGDFNTGANYEASGLPKYARLTDLGFITHADRTINIQELPDISDANLKHEISHAIKALADRGYEVFVLETTHPQLRVPAFYVMIPGMQFRERPASMHAAMMAAKLTSASEPADLALARLQSMKTALPQAYYVPFYMGRLLVDMGNYDEADNYFQHALSLHPPDQDRVSIWVYSAICQKERQRYEPALRLLRAAEQIDQERTDIFNLKGFCYFKQKKHHRAIDAFKQVLKLNPASAIDYANIAVNYRAIGKIDQAVEYFGLALSIDPSIDFAREHLQQLADRAPS